MIIIMNRAKQAKGKKSKKHKKKSKEQKTENTEEKEQKEGDVDAKKVGSGESTEEDIEDVY